MNKKIVIITPTFGASGTGASIYYLLLANQLNAAGYDAVIISDKDSQEHANHKVHKIFPARCLRSKRGLIDYILYFIQNIAYFSIPIILYRERPYAVIVHSSFFNTIGIFGIVTKIMKPLFGKVRFILDVRDMMLPANQKLIESFDSTIACSENVYTYLMRISNQSDRITKIPVIQESIFVDKSFSEKILNKYSLTNKGYILSVGSVKEEKGTMLLLESYVEHMQQKIPNIPLVIVGLLKSTDPYLLSLLSSIGVIYLGVQDRDIVTTLMSKAAVCVNMSTNEGMPRTSLEPLSMGVKCVLPETVPEFVEYCSEFVCRDRTSHGVSEFITMILERDLYPNYPANMHSIDSVIPKYLNLLDQ